MRCLRQADEASCLKALSQRRKVDWYIVEADGAARAECKTLRRIGGWTRETKEKKKKKRKKKRKIKMEGASAKASRLRN
jgi:hypothetical protein